MDALTIHVNQMLWIAPGTHGFQPVCYRTATQRSPAGHRPGKGRPETSDGSKRTHEKRVTDLRTYDDFTRKAMRVITASGLI
jgi:hypothetical protein